MRSAAFMAAALLLSAAAAASGQDSLQADTSAAVGAGASSPPLRYAIGFDGERTEADTLDLYTVEFRFAPAATPSQVYLVGSFNGGDANADPMEGPDSDGAFRLVKHIPPGTHEYYFLADGVEVLESGFPADSRIKSAVIARYPAFVVDDRFDPVVLQRGDGVVFGEGLGLGPGATTVTRISFDTLAVATRVHRNDVDSAAVLFRSGGRERAYPLDPSGSDTLFTYYRGEFPAPAGMEGRILVRLKDGEAVRFITTAGLENTFSLSRMRPVGPIETPLTEVPGWVTGGVSYHIVPDLFRNGNKANDPKTKKGFRGGDLEGVLEKLSWIADLGVTAISFSPLQDSPSPYRYDAGDWKKVGAGIGGNDAFRLVVEEAHRNGLRVIVTVTFHSTSNEHFAFRDALKNGGASKYSTWYEWKKWPVPERFTKGDGPPNYYECLNRDGILPAVNYGDGKAPALNYDLAHPRSEELEIEHRRDAEVNESLLAEVDSTIAFWLTTMDVDGLIVHDPAETPPWLNRHVREAVERLKPDAYLAAEGEFRRGGVFDSYVQSVVDLLLTYRAFAPDAQKLVRETARIRGIRPINVLRASTGITYRGWGGRSSLYDPGGMILLAYTHLLTSPGFPRIVWGDEVGTVADSIDGVASPYPWDQVLEPSRLAVREQFRRLIAVRLEHPAFSRGREKVLLAEGSVMAKACWHDWDKLLVVMNAGERPAEIAIRIAALPFPADGPPEELLTSGAVVENGADGSFTVRLVGRSAAILRFPGNG